MSVAVRAARTTVRRIGKAVDDAGTWALSPPRGPRRTFVYHGPRDARKVALTFDDGPSEPCTTHLLDVMDELQVPGTFFCVGVNSRWHPDTLRRMLASGHVLANHSGWHSRKEGLRLRSALSHVIDGESAIEEAVGRRPALYRPPWGWLTPWEARRLRRHGYTVVGWDVYTLDWKWPELDAEVVVDDALPQVRPGSIILLHDANAGVQEWHKTETARAVRLLVTRLRADGYEFVTVPELLDVPAYR